MAVERAAELNRQLLTSSRHLSSPARRLDVAEVVQNFERLLVRLAGPAVRVRVAARSALPSIEMDPLRLEQVLMNLVINARDAMPDGGLVTVDCDHVVLDAPHVALNPGARLGPHVVIAVADTGTGMDSATLERIFEAFFTTKAGGRGTGLGLAIVREIISGNGGHVTASSRPGQGSTFRVYLPARGEAARVEGARS